MFNLSITLRKEMKTHTKLKIDHILVEKIKPYELTIIPIPTKECTYSFILYEDDEDRLFSIGNDDIIVYKQNVKEKNLIIKSKLFDLKEIEGEFNYTNISIFKRHRLNSEKDKILIYSWNDRMNIVEYSNNLHLTNSIFLQKGNCNLYEEIKNYEKLLISFYDLTNFILIQGYISTIIDKSDEYLTDENSMISLLDNQYNLERFKIKEEYKNKTFYIPNDESDDDILFKFGEDFIVYKQNEKDLSIKYSLKLNYYGNNEKINYQKQTNKCEIIIYKYSIDPNIILPFEEGFEDYLEQNWDFNKDQLK